MKVSTIGETTAGSVALIALFSQKAQDQAPRTDPDGKPKTVLGRPTFRTVLKALELDDEGQPLREIQNATIALLTPTALEAGKPYTLSGYAQFTPYVANGSRLGISIVAESVIPSERVPSDFNAQLIALISKKSAGIQQ